MRLKLIELGMKQLTKVLLIATALVISACSNPSGVTLRWSPPSQFDDGGALPDNAVTEYRVYVNQEMVQQVEPHLTEYFLELGRSSDAQHLFPSASPTHLVRS